MANAIFLMPRNQRDSNPVIQALLQGMSWCEKDREADIASRNAYITSQGKVSALATAPASPDTLSSCTVILMMLAISIRHLQQ